MMIAGDAYAATIAVTEVDDGLTGSACTLRGAIDSVNGGANASACVATGAAYGTSDTINLPAGTYTNALAGGGEDLNATGDLDLLASVTLTGAGASTTFIDGGAIDRVMHVAVGVTVSISDVTIQNGSSPGDGGGIYNSGTLDLTGVTLSGNAVTVAFTYAGAIYNNGGALTLTDVTVSGNTALGGNVGMSGIYNVGGGTLTIDRSTFSGNTANVYGSLMNSVGSCVITNSTFSGNTIQNNAVGDISNASTMTIKNTTVTGSSRYGIYAGNGAITVSNTIVTGNTGNACNITGGTITSNGYNLDDDGTCPFGGVGDISGSALANLGALANNGGSTQTHALLSGSAALDTGDCSGGTVTTDQRGTARPQGSACDIGAYEAKWPTVSVTKNGSGSVFDNGGLAGFTIACGATCSDTVFEGDSVDLTAIPGVGVNFTGWSGACSGTGHCVLNAIAADKSVTATFITPGAPVVTTDAATGVTRRDATMNGTVNPDNGGATTVTFEYGETNAYGATVAADQSPLADSGSDTGVTASLTGLTCGTTYHYRVVATNATGTS
ncbi:MAG: hypothetical protein HQK87_05365, partial [Nitrospinae bacterium]|nr:hypothetical protein [Nitrospinota bacterium]